MPLLSSSFLTQRVFLSMALKLGIWLLVCVVCIAVFAAYLSPSFLINVADQLWGCF
jgi:hypothetical protein